MAVRHPRAGGATALLALAAATAAAPAAAQPVDPREAWLTLATPHFRVHVPARLEGAGRRAAADAERAWAQLAAELAPPRGPVELVVADNVDVTQGYATTFPSNRIVVFAQPPVAEGALRFYDDWSQLVITHELAHVFHLDRSRGGWRLLQRLLGRHPALFPNAYAPAWVTEGLAVHFESRLTGAGRLVGTEHRLLARAAARDGRIPRLDQLSLATTTFPGGQRAYVYGSLLIDDLARRGPPDGLRRFVDRAGGQLVPYRLDHAARRAFGTSLTGEWRRWRDSLAAAVRADTAAPRGPVDAGWTTLVDDGWLLAYPRWRPDGRLAVARADARSVTQAVLVDTAGRARRLGRRNGLSPNVLLRGGPHAGATLFAQPEYLDPFTLRSDLWVERGPVADFGAAAGRQRRLTRGARLSAPDARADGAIVAVQTVGPTTRVARVAADGGAIAALTVAHPDTQWSDPRWSPAGTRVAAVRIARGGTSAVVVLDTVPGAPARVVWSERGVSATPVWVGEDSLLWTSDRTGGGQLHRAAIGGAALRVSDVPTAAVQPDVAPAAGAGGARTAALLLDGDGYRLAVAGPATLAPVAAPAAAAAAAAGGSSAPPAPAGAADAAPVPALSAPSVYPARSAIGPAAAAAGAARRYTPWRTLVPRYWTPIAYGADLAGTVWGAATSGVDVVGRHAYGAQLAVNARTGDLEGAIGWRWARLARPFVDLYASQGWLYDSVLVRTAAPGGAGTVRAAVLDRRVRQAGATLSLLRPRARTNASLALGAAMEWRDYDASVPGAGAAFARALGTRFPSATLSGSWLNTRRPLRSISPEDGVSLSGSVQRRWQDGGVGGASNRALGALRAYRALDLPGFAHHVLALRVAGGATDARATTELSAGGVSGASAELLPGVSVGDPSRPFFARGFGAGAQRGVRAAAASAEYRAPLARPSRGAALLPAFLDRTSLALFADAASAWCPAGIDRAAQPLCSRSLARTPTAARWMTAVGAELALDAALQYDAPYRFRLGVAAPVTQRALAGARASAYLTLGLAF